MATSEAANGKCRLIGFGMVPFEEGKCQGCGYSLTGNESDVCPDCGTEIEQP